MPEEPNSTGTEFFISSGLAAFVRLQNQKSVNGATNIGLCFTVRAPVDVKWSSADEAVVRSGTGFPSPKLSFSSTLFQTDLTNLPKLCLLRFAYSTVLQPLCCPANTFSEPSYGIWDWKFQTEQTACA